MEIEEIYGLSSLSVSFGKRKITIDFQDFSAEYFYNGHSKKWKPITFERLCKFTDKYRGKKLNNYNRPSVEIKKFNTKD